MIKKGIIHKRKANEISNFFISLAEQDEKAATELCRMGLYNISIYHVIQAMEKYIKYFISKKIDFKHKKIAEILAIHNIEELVDIMLDIYFNSDPYLKDSLKVQLKDCLDLSRTNYSKMQNELRYPKYNTNFYVLEATKDNVQEYLMRLKKLKNYLEEMSKRY